MVHWPKNFDPPFASYQEQEKYPTKHQAREQDNIRHATRFYSTIEEASQGAQALNIQTGPEYSERYHLDRRLPADPYHFYGAKAWKKIGGMPGFLGKKAKTPPYSSLRRASRAARKLNIKTQIEYMERYHEDPCLRARPDRTYPDQWKKLKRKWRSFLGQP